MWQRMVVFGDSVSVGAFSSISDARFGEGLVVHAHCSLHKVIAEEHVMIYPHSGLGEEEGNVRTVKRVFSRPCCGIAA